MAANTNPFPSELPSQGPSNEATSPAQPTKTAIPTPTYLTSDEAEQIMLDIDVESHESASKRSIRRLADKFKNHYKLCRTEYPRIETTMKNLDAKLRALEYALVVYDKAGYENLLQNVALLATLMGGDATTTASAEVCSPIQAPFQTILQVNFAKCLTFHQLAVLGHSETHEHLAMVNRHANAFTNYLTPAMAYVESRSGRTVPPKFRLVRAIRDKALIFPYGKIGVERRLRRFMEQVVSPLETLLDAMGCQESVSSIVEKDIRMMAYLLSHPAFRPTLPDRNMWREIIGTWENSQNMRQPCNCTRCEAGRQNPQMDFNMAAPQSTDTVPAMGTSVTGMSGIPAGPSTQSLLGLPEVPPDRRFPIAQRDSESTMAPPGTSTSNAFAPGSGMSSQQMPYTSCNTPHQTAPLTTSSPPSWSNTTPQMGSTVAAPSFTDPVPAMGTSVTGMPSIPAGPSMYSLPGHPQEPAHLEQHGLGVPGSTRPDENGQPGDFQSGQDEESAFDANLWYLSNLDSESDERL